MGFGTGGQHISVNVTTRGLLVAEVARRLAAGQGFALAAVGPAGLAGLAADAPDLTTAGSRAVVWLSRLAGQRAERIAAADLALPLARLALAEGLGLGLCGSDAAALDRLGRRLRRALPGLKIIAVSVPPEETGSAAIAEALVTLRHAGIRLCLVALEPARGRHVIARWRAAAPEIGLAAIGPLPGPPPATVRAALQRLQTLARRWRGHLVLSALLLLRHGLRALRRRR